jgi:hypothetical protein
MARAGLVAMPSVLIHIADVAAMVATKTTAWLRGSNGIARKIRCEITGDFARERSRGSDAGLRIARPAAD